MKRLLKKEFCFTALPLTYFFLLFAFMTLIPGYPILVGSFFVCLGIFQTFLSAREQNDILYTVLMPVSKSDAVKARYYFVAAIQMMFLALCALLTVIRMTVLAGSTVYLTNAMMNANPMYLGYILLVFVLFNWIFVDQFWKTAYNAGKPFISFCIAAMVMVGISEILHHLPGMGWMNTANEQLPLQYLFLGCSAVIYILAGRACIKKSCRSIEKIDL
jgi:hypothetical protein